MIDFQGRVLILTGANGAITRAIARAFFELGADLLVWRSNVHGLASRGAGRA